MEVHINLSHISPPQIQSGSQLRINQARRMVQKANKTLHRLEVNFFLPLSLCNKQYFVTGEDIKYEPFLMYCRIQAIRQKTVEDSRLWNQKTCQRKRPPLKIPDKQQKGAPLLIRHQVGAVKLKVQRVMEVNNIADPGKSE